LKKRMTQQPRKKGNRKSQMGYVVAMGNKGDRSSWPTSDRKTTIFMFSVNAPGMAKKGKADEVSREYGKREGKGPGVKSL